MIRKSSTYKSFLIIVSMVVLSVSSINQSKAQQYTEYEVKAAYIYNFINFIQWPNSAFSSTEAKFVIGIYGYDPFKGILDEVFRNKLLQNREWEIKYFSSVKDISDCHILLISDISQTELITVLEKIKNKPILSIGNQIDNFCDLGGIVNFSKQNEQHRFEINNNQAVNNNLKINPKLLFLSKIISEDENRF